MSTTTLLILLAIAALALAGCKEVPDSAPGGSAKAPSEKNILAVQAFIDREPSERIMAICSSIKNVEGFYTELGGFVPHITVASYRVTSQELQVAESQFSKALAGLSCIQVKMTLQEEDRGDRFSYFLLPEPTPALLDFHARAHSKLGWCYEPFRQIDLPGKWRPHLTLFSIPKSERRHVSNALVKLRQIRVVTIERIGLLGFSPTRVLSEARLGNGDAAK